MNSKLIAVLGLCTAVLIVNNGKNKGLEFMLLATRAVVLGGIGPKISIPDRRPVGRPQRRARKRFVL